MKVELSDLERFLSCRIPKGYIEYVDGAKPAALEKRGFDPKTLCVLNLGLRESDRDGWTRDRFFLSGDGVGNYYFVSIEENHSGQVLLWSHDPPGIEDPKQSLQSFLESATQENRIVESIRPESFCIARTKVIGESVLDPISLEEWRRAISSCEGVRYRGYRTGKNPFTDEILRFDAPGLALAEFDGGAVNLQLHSGRVEGNYLSKAHLIVETLAHVLKANLTVRTP